MEGSTYTGKHEVRRTTSSALITYSLFLIPSISMAAAAGEASANALALKGGMSLIDGTFITAVFMGLSCVIGSIGTLMWGKHKAAKAQRPVDSDDRFVTQLECRNHRCALEKRIDELGPALERIFKKLTDNDKRSEERSNQMHRRIDPLIERTAANTQAIEMFKDFAREATVGGRK